MRVCSCWVLFPSSFVVYGGRNLLLVKCYVIGRGGFVVYACFNDAYTKCAYNVLEFIPGSLPFIGGHSYFFRVLEIVVSIGLETW